MDNVVGWCVTHCDIIAGGEGNADRVEENVLEKTEKSNRLCRQVYIKRDVSQFISYSYLCVLGIIIQ